MILGEWFCQKREGKRWSTRSGKIWKIWRFILSLNGRLRVYDVYERGKILRQKVPMAGEIIKVVSNSMLYSFTFLSLSDSNCIMSQGMQLDISLSYCEWLIRPMNENMFFLSPLQFFFSLLFCKKGMRMWKIQECSWERKKQVISSRLSWRHEIDCRI